MRTLDWDGGRNIRDLGGLPAPFSPIGATIRGRVARGPRRELLSHAGWRAASAWGVRSIVDLRNADEVGARPGDPDSMELPELMVVRAPTEEQSHPEFREVCLPILDSPEYWRHNVRILPHLIRAALEAVAASEPAVLVHCAAGRDRTGLISAILLANAGVPSAAVAADYAESVRSMAGPAGGGDPAHDRQAAWTPDDVDRQLVLWEPIVAAFADDIDELLDAVQLPETTRSALRALLTDPEHSAATR